MTTQKNRLHSATDILLAMLLAAMAVLVFGNVIMRYFFNSGLPWAEELSRFSYVWLIFLGSIVAFASNDHLGVDTLLNRLSPKGRKSLYVFNNVVILGTMALTFDGCLRLTVLNLVQSSPALEIPYAYVYISGVILSGGICLITIRNIYRLLTGSLSDADLIMTKDSEDNIKEMDEK